MSNAKFTKGKWVINYTGTHWNNPTLRNIEVNYGSQGECICDTVYNDSDAHLIAAAPEMYEILESIYNAACYTGTYSSEMDQIKALLAKARGEL
tara:strand:+ start:44 stop:325 length:282 start_codon:yes stop_codon:yes gene_type:complete